MANHTLADYCSALKTHNHLDLGDVHAATTRIMSLAKHGNDFLNSPWGTMTRIQIFVVLAVTSMLFLEIFGTWRRQSKNWLTQKGFLLTYTMSPSLISYAFGSMQSSPVKSDSYPLWALALNFLFISSVNYSLTDNNETTLGQLLKFILDLVYALLISSTVSSDIGFFMVFLMGFFVYIRFFYKIWINKVVATSLDLNKIVADYMEKEHEQYGPGSPPHDPCRMKGYRYLVDWTFQDVMLQEDGISYGAPLLTKDGTHVIDIEKVWMVNDGSLSPDLRDTCLSFSLFHLLRRRFFGFACAESCQQKTHDFVFKGLLAKDEGGVIDFHRAFKVIEVELAFMYDFFFTKYAGVYYGSSSAAPFWSLASASFMFVTAYQSAISNSRISVDGNVDVCFLLNTPSLTVDFVITLLTLESITVLEILQQLLLWTSIWGRVSFVCQHVREQASINTKGFSWCVKFICKKLKEILAKIGALVRNQSFWQNKLDQYSLLESICYNPSPGPVVLRNPFLAVAFRLMAAIIGVNLRAISLVPVVGDNLHGRIVRKLGKPIKLPPQVKKAIVQSLERTDGNLTNGKYALDANGADDLSWALRLHEKWTALKMENQTVIILTWHIATCYCEMATMKHLCPTVGGALKDNIDVATILSKYCAYLVAFKPKLLPGHHYDTKSMFKGIAAEASGFLGQDKDMCNKYERMASSQEAKGQFFHNGVKLGKQLQDMEECARWKVLAEFWAEMLIYLAPSDNVQEHVECLAKGGELITHLWALLTHAGILDRGKRNNVTNDIENPGDGPSSSYTYSCTSTTCAAPCTCDTNQPPTTRNPTVQLTKRDAGESCHMVLL